MVQSGGDAFLRSVYSKLKQSHHHRQGPQPAAVAEGSPRPTAAAFASDYRRKRRGGARLQKAKGKRLPRRQACGGSPPYALAFSRGSPPQACSGRQPHPTGRHRRQVVLSRRQRAVQGSSGLSRLSPQPAARSGAVAAEGAATHRSPAPPPLAGRWTPQRAPPPPVAWSLAPPPIHLAATTATSSFFVSPIGNDAAAGTSLAAPHPTLWRARDARP